LKEIIVISGANLFSGGTLSILNDCLKYADEKLSEKYEVVALVYNLEDFSGFGKIKILEFPEIRKSYFHRLYYEYYYYKKLSRELNPYLWLSLNDISSNIVAVRRAVYCHNPTPFKKLKVSDLWNQTQVFFFTIFYKYLYKINIKKNNYVIVQQNWLRNEFVKMFSLQKEKVIVAPPKVPHFSGAFRAVSNGKPELKTNFLFPTFPRPFKNVELICEAVEILNRGDLKEKFNVKITIDGTENGYSSGIIKKYRKLSQIDFVGQISRQSVYDLYTSSDCLIFPSTLETWGLPITEFKMFNKPILLSDLPYAHETLGRYDKGVFFNPSDSGQLAKLMSAVIDNSIQFSSHDHITISQPVANDWDEVFSLLLDR
jgi:glycosyltransferase involved in cell wall biosynthesis